MGKSKREASKTSDKFRRLPPSRKKNIIWHTTLGTILIEETNFLSKKTRKESSHRLHPFQQLTGICNRFYSLRIQRFITDFGAEHSFEASVKKMQEHHPLASIPTSSARCIVQKYANLSRKHLPGIFSMKEESKQMIVEMDGEMIPTVSFDPGKDKRKNRKVAGEELRIGVAQNAGENEWKYASSFESPDQLGQRLQVVMKCLGWKETTQVHGIGDGACWITEQGEKIGGPNFSYLIDIYHLCEYFSAAFEGLRLEPKRQMLLLKDKCKAGKIEEVISLLEKEKELAPEHEGLEACLRYMRNRVGQFNYAEAIAKELPIGSGKVESTHRSLIQRRLKIPGAWWRRENADAMASLRTLRANGGWELLWNKNSSRLYKI
jgi:hypothetical protein